MKRTVSMTLSVPPMGTPQLYPELLACPAVAEVPLQHDNTPPDQYYWLQEISKLRKHLQDERDKHSQLYKKYRWGVNAVDAADMTLISASMGMGFGGVGLLSVIIAAPIVLGLEIAALACGLLGVTGKFIGWVSRLRPKSMRSESWQAEHHCRLCLACTNGWPDLWWGVQPHCQSGCKIPPDEGWDPGWSTESPCCSHLRWGGKKRAHPTGPRRGQGQLHEEAGQLYLCLHSIVPTTPHVRWPTYMEPLDLPRGGGGSWRFWQGWGPALEQSIVW